MTTTPVPQAEQKTQPKPLYLPTKHENCNQVIAYLRKRGIDRRVIQDCIDAGSLYESAPYHNAVFIGKDDNGQPRYAACRSTMGSSFKRDASGSDKRFSFRLLAQKPCTSVHLFEAAIDLLSFATYLQHKNRDYQKENLLSLAGVYQPKKDIKSSKIPVALSEFLKKNPSVKTIYLHLDNDKAGRLSTAALKELLKSQYEIVDAPPPIGKDVNDFCGISRKNPIEGSVIQDDDIGSKAAGTVLASIDFGYPKSKLRGKSPETPYLQKGRNRNESCCDVLCRCMDWFGSRRWHDVSVTDQPVSW